MLVTLIPLRQRVLVAAVILSFGLVAACVPLPPEPSPPSGGGGGGGAPPPPPPPGPQPFSDVRLTLTQVAPLPGAMTMAARTGDPALYVAMRDGLVQQVIVGGAITAALDIRSQVTTDGECGLLGLAFSPDGSKLYVHYSLKAVGTPQHCATVVDEYAFSGSSAVLPARRVLTVEQPQVLNHKGGSMLFGPDGMLYLALGDGGGGNDQGAGQPPGGNAQSPNTLLGKILRINPADPDGGGALTYTVPPDNPFVGTAPLDEIWSFGLRNPFRMSFDSATGDLWVGDVGQGAREEISWVPDTGAQPHGRGANFGWNRREGDLAGPDSSPTAGPTPFTDPVLAINRSQGDRSVIGGYVYRGGAIPELAGAYLFADFFHYAIRALRINGSGTVVEFRDFTSAVGADGTASFGEDNAGELYVVSLYSGVYRIDKVP